MNKIFDFDEYMVWMEETITAVDKIVDSIMEIDCNMDTARNHWMEVQGILLSMVEDTLKLEGLMDEGIVVEMDFDTGAGYLDITGGVASEEGRTEIMRAGINAGFGYSRQGEDMRFVKEYK